MEPYIYLLIFSIIASVVSILKLRILEKICFWILSFCIIGIVAFRHYTIGTDTIGYYYFFLDPSNGYSSYNVSDIEIGYRLMNVLGRSISMDGNTFLSVCAVISILPFIYIIWKESSNRLFSLFLLISLGTTTIFYILFFSMIRQCLAFGIISIGLYWFYKRKKRNFYFRFIPVILACAFHSTALFTLPLFFIDYIKLKKKMMYLCLIITWVIGTILVKFKTLLFGLSGILGDGHFNFYVDIIGGNIYSIGVSVPLLLICFLMYYVADEKMQNNVYVKIFTIGVMLNNLFYLVGNSDRLNLYFGIYGCLAIPYIYEALKKYKSKFIQISFLIIILGYYSSKYVKVFENAKQNPIVQLVPYKSYL